MYNAVFDVAYFDQTQFDTVFGLETITINDSIRDFPRLHNKIYSFTKLLTDDVTDHFDMNKILLDDVYGMGQF